MNYPLLKIKIAYEQDIVLVRQRARTIAALLGFEHTVQSRIATALSEIARNAYQYAGGGNVEFAIEGRDKPQVFSITVTDAGPGIKDTDAILEGRYKSKTGMGLGIVGARQLMDQFLIESTPGKGTVVKLGRIIPVSFPPVTQETVRKIVEELANQLAEDPFQEIRQQNLELINALDELRQRQMELEKLNRELEDTNRGVVALYAELDEKTAHLASANELKVRFLSNMSHEFRTPLNSILSLSRILLDRVDGDLTDEQEKQVTYIQKSASDLSNLINDLLDISKIEAGRTTVTVTDFEVSTILSALRGMLRPLLVNPQVTLAIEEAPDIPTLHTDEGKVSQILRNLVSNAIRFTEKGKIIVSAHLEEDGKTVVFSVADTGIGIAPEDQERIFDEYVQIDSALQRKTKGTGLGLSLSRKLAQMLGGDITVESAPGRGSVFSATIPCHYPDAPSLEAQTRPPVAEDTTRYPVLIIEDNQSTQALYEKYLKGTGFQVLPAYSLREAHAILEKTKPFAIVLDILLPGEDSWALISELKNQDATRDIPVIIVTILEEQQRGIMLGAEDFCTKPVERKWLLGKLRKISARIPVERVLIIDDEEIARYIMRGILSDTKYKVIEASGGIEGLEKAQRQKPDLILLDLMMPDMNGFEVLAKLKEDKATRHIPVIIVTSKVLEKEETEYLSKYAQAIVAKGQTSSDAVMLSVRQALVKAAAGRNTNREEYNGKRKKKGNSKRR